MDIEDILTRPQREEIKRLTASGYSRIAAIRYLLHLGRLVREIYDLETDLCHGTNYVIHESKRK